jgi:hypothetical protein
MTDGQLWAATYLGINLVVSVGFVFLARFIRRTGKTPGPERAGKLASAALVALTFGSLFVAKLVSAQLSGWDFNMGRRGDRAWRWLARETDPVRFLQETIMNLGFASICLVAALCFMRIRSLALSPALAPAKRMDHTIRWLFVMFWSAVLLIELMLYASMVWARS